MVVVIVDVCQLDLFAGWSATCTFSDRIPVLSFPSSLIESGGEAAGELGRECRSGACFQENWCVICLVAWSCRGGVGL